MPSHNPQPRTPVSADALEGDLVRPGDRRYGIIWMNPERMSGAPCFYGTRVPVKTLFEYIEGGDTLDEFLDGFPGVSREQAVAALNIERDRAPRPS